MERARIVIADDECYFEQGDIRFNVDRYNLWKVLGAGSFNREGSVIDRLTDSAIISLAHMNDLEVDPYDRDLLRSPLNRVVQFTWMRDVGGFDDDAQRERFEKKDREAIELYHRRLQDLRDHPREKSEPSYNETRWMRTYRVAPSSDGIPKKGRDRTIYEIVRDLKESTFAQIMEAAKNRVETRSKLEYVVGHFVNSLHERGAIILIDSSGNPIPPKEKKQHDRKQRVERDEGRPTEEKVKASRTRVKVQRREKQEITFTLD